MTRKPILDQQKQCSQIDVGTIPESSSTTLKTLGHFLTKETAKTGASPTAFAILAFQIEQSDLREDLLDHATLATPAAIRPLSPKAAVRTPMLRVAEDLGRAKTLTHGAIASTRKSAFQTSREPNNGVCWPRGITTAVHFKPVNIKRERLHWGGIPSCQDQSSGLPGTPRSTPCPMVPADNSYAGPRQATQGRTAQPPACTLHEKRLLAANPEEEAKKELRLGSRLREGTPAWGLCSNPSFRLNFPEK